MKRTRKWAYVAQEAKRLAALGMPAQEIATRLELSRRTVWRWMKEGKLPDTGRSGRGPDVVPTVLSGTLPTEWAAAVRRTYGLDATDDQLVALAEVALSTARDPLTSMTVRLAAMGRFQALVKQLVLVARTEDEPEQKPRAVQPARDRSVDPRTQLLQ